MALTQTDSFSASVTFVFYLPRYSICILVVSSEMVNDKAQYNIVIWSRFLYLNVENGRKMRANGRRKRVDLRGKCRLFIGFSHVQWLPAAGDFQ